MQLTRLILVAACCALNGCAHLDIELAGFMSPDRGTRAARLPPGYVIENRIIAADGRSIGITYARHPGSQATILFCGGDAFHRSIEGGEALQALAVDADVVLFDYPGYGDTTGAPSTEAILDTATAAYDYVFGLESTAAKKRVLYGFSLGGMVAAHLAQDRRADGLVLESTPPSVRGWAQSRIPIAFRPMVKLRIEPQLAAIDSVAALEHFRGKVLLLASRSDEMVPAKLSFDLEQRLREAHRDIRLVEFPGRRHGNINRSPAFPATLRNFLEQVRLMP